MRFAEDRTHGKRNQRPTTTTWKKTIDNPLRILKCQLLHQDKSMDATLDAFGGHHGKAHQRWECAHLRTPCKRVSISQGLVYGFDRMSVPWAVTDFDQISSHQYVLARPWRAEALRIILPHWLVLLTQHP